MLNTIRTIKAPTLLQNITVCGYPQIGTNSYSSCSYLLQPTIAMDSTWIREQYFICIVLRIWVRLQFFISVSALTTHSKHSTLSGPMSFYRLRALSVHGLYSAKLRIRRRAPEWIKRGLNTPKHTLQKKQNVEMEVTNLEDTLVNNWRELDKMLICSKMSFCAKRYKKNFQMGQVNVLANLMQSLTITLYHVKDLNNKLRKLKGRQYQMEDLILIPGLEGQRMILFPQQRLGWLFVLCNHADFTY